MKQRLIIAISLSIAIIVFTPIALSVFDIRSQGIFTIIAIVSFVYIGVYIFGGLPKLIVFGIYGVFLSLSLSFIPYEYQLPIVILGTLLFILNPLVFFEKYLESRMKDENVLPISISIRGSYWPFFSYRKEMKNFYHLPQQRKLHTKPWYLHSRQITMVLLYTLGTFIFLRNLSLMTNSLDDFNWFHFFALYDVIIIFLLAYFVHIKGFTSTFRTFGIALFPPILFLVSISSMQLELKLGLNISIAVFAIIISIVEIIRFHHRVVYDAYQYYDVDQQMEVYANALFEPLVYNETFTLSGIYKLKLTKKQFHKQFNDLLVYANYFHFIISAYTIQNEFIYIYTELHYKDVKRAQKFKTYIEGHYQTNVELELVSDPEKTIYEKTFFHRPEYIIARAQRLAELLKDLHIDSNIIISIVAYFDSEKDLKAMNQLYQITKMPNLTVEDFITVRIDVQTINNDYLIETKIRDILLSLLVNNGQFVRISVFY